MYAVTPADVTQLESLRELDYVDFWMRLKSPGVPCTVMVAPEKLQRFQDYLQGNQIKHEVIIRDAQE